MVDWYVIFSYTLYVNAVIFLQILLEKNTINVGDQEIQ